jgi:phosphoglycerol transferase MdoB-like AlkP superfamily enzyme
MTLSRLIFTFYFGDIANLEANISDVLYAYFLGWKYDSIVACYALVPSYLLLIFVTFFKKNILNNIYQFINQIYFLTITFVIVALLISDLGFYSFFQDHINILFFGILEDDTMALIETIQKNYPVTIMTGGVVVLTGLVLYFYRKIFTYTKKNDSRVSNGPIKYLSLLTVTLILLFGGLRGGYGIMVISPKYSDFSDNEFINQIALNGVIAFEKTYKLRKENNSEGYNLSEKFGYKKIQDAFSDYLGIDVSLTKRDELIGLIKRVTSKNTSLEELKPNVVVIVMESFGANWLQYHSNEFNILGGLEKHFEEDYLFKNIISSDNGTIGSLMAIGTNIPNRPGARFLSESKYLQTPLDSSSNIPYLNSGYETNFMYGGKLGWRDIGRYFKYQKFDNLIGENYISKELNLEGHQGTEWGLYDEHLFNMIEKKILVTKRPQFIMALSTSNHPPFEVPKNYELKPLEIPVTLDSKILREKDLFLARFKTFQYANAQLAKFISNIKKSDAGKNTIIAITGDHNFWGSINYSKKESFYKHTVPLYFYIPKEIFSKKVDLNKIASHEDIMTSLYNLSLSETGYVSFGENLFNEGRTYAIGANLFAGDEGVIYRDAKFQWDNIPYVEAANEDINLKNLESNYKSTLSVADYFLRMSLKKESN